MTSPDWKGSYSRDPRLVKIRSTATDGISAVNAAMSVASEKIKASTGKPIKTNDYGAASIPFVLSKSSLFLQQSGAYFIVIAQKSNDYFLFCLIFVVFDHCELSVIHLNIIKLNYYQYIHGLYLLSLPKCVIFKHNHMMSHCYCHRRHFYTFHSQHFFDYRHSNNQLSS